MDERYGDWVVEADGVVWYVVHAYEEHAGRIRCMNHEAAMDLAKCLARNAI